MKKYFFLLLGLLTVYSCSENKNAGQKAPARVAIQVVGASVGDDGQTYVGIVEESKATAVSFTGMGVVRRVLVSEGQTVSKGQLLAEMDDTQARNLLAGAEAQMAQADDALSRYKMLHDNGSLPEVQWVEIQSKVAQAKSQLEIAKKNLADCRLVAPVGGVIGKKMIGAGETALPSQAVLTILDINSIKVKVAVPERDINAISSSTPSTITVAAVNETVNGGSIEKGIEADALTHTYEVRINVANRGRKLLPGMVASVRFGSPHPTSPLGEESADGQIIIPPRGDRRGAFIPVTAVQHKADGSLFVWTIAADSTAHRTAVSIGATSGNNVTVTDGLDVGQRIVTEGYQKLSEGTRVVY